jgi:hypothetical protein
MMRIDIVADKDMSMTTQRHTMNQILLYSLRFELIYQYRLWGGGNIVYNQIGTRYIEILFPTSLGKL